MFHFLDKLFNKKNVVKEVFPDQTDLQTQLAPQTGTFYPIIAYLGVKPTRIQPFFVDVFNEIFSSKFTEFNLINYYVCLIKIVLEKEYWMVRYAFFSEDEQIQASKMYVNVLDAIQANSLPNLIFEKREMDVLLFDGQPKKVSEIADMIDSWTKENKNNYG